jgi:predicted phosphodiesterase
MEIIERELEVKSNSDTFQLYVIGDVHLGAFNCAETHLRQFVEYLKSKPNALWIGGGDYCNCITPSDVNRYDVRAMANWIFTGSAMNIKEALCDISKQERERFGEIVEPIKDKCIGLIEGNHEFQLMKHAHNGHHYVMCDELGVKNLTDCAFIRLVARNKIKGNGSSIIIFLMHGRGGGRTPGAEPNHLARIGQFVDADIILRGDSHTFRIEPPVPRLYIPHKGALPDECMEREVFKANWGCWLKSYARGPSTYDSRAAYPARPLRTVEAIIKPMHQHYKRVCGRRVTYTQPRIIMQECPYEI